MAFEYAYFFSDFLCIDMSPLLLTVTLRGVSNKHCLLSFFSFMIEKLMHVVSFLYNQWIENLYHENFFKTSRQLV